MNELLMNVFVGSLIALPLCSSASTVYLWRLYRRTLPRSLLALLLAIDATVGLLAGGTLGALTVNARLLGNVNPPQLLPVTLIALVAVLAMPNVIAFMLYRSSRRRRL